MSSPVASWRKTKEVTRLLNKTGKLLVWTKIHAAPSGFEDYGSYISGIVEFEDGKKVPVQIVDCTEDQLKVGMEVITVVRRGAHVNASDIIEYVIKVVPTKIKPK